MLTNLYQYLQTKIHDTLSNTIQSQQCIVWIPTANMILDCLRLTYYIRKTWSSSYKFQIYPDKNIT